MAKMPEQRHHVVRHAVLGMFNLALGVFEDGLNMLGFSAITGFGAAILERLDRIASALKDTAQARQIP